MAPESTMDIDGKTFTISHESETDEGGNVSQFILLTCGEEVHRLSPNTTPEELARYADPNDGNYVI